MRNSPERDHLELWRGIDDAVLREAARAHLLKPATRMSEAERVHPKTKQVKPHAGTSLAAYETA